MLDPAIPPDEAQRLDHEVADHVAQALVKSRSGGEDLVALLRRLAGRAPSTEGRA